MFYPISCFTLRARSCLLALCLLWACGQPEERQPLPKAFQAARSKAFSQRRPLDSLLIIGPEQLLRWDSLYQAFHRRLETTSGLLRHDREELMKGLAEVEAHILQYRQDPSVYNLGGALKQVLAAEQAPLARRMLAIEAQMKQAPLYYQAAKANLSAPLPHRCRLAAGKQSLAIGFLSGELLDSLQRVDWSAAEAQRFRQTAAAAKIAVKDYLAFCESLYFEHQDSLILRNR